MRASVLLVSVLFVAAGLCAAGCVAIGGAPLAPRDFSLVVSEGGGFTGAESGAEVAADGAVRSWGEVGRLPVRLSNDDLQTLWVQARQGYHDARPKGSGTLIRTIRVRSGGEDSEARWVPGTEPDLDRLYDELWETIRSGFVPPDHSAMG